MFGNSGISLADIAAVTKGNGENDGFGGNNGWWILIILFALFGWGNNGWGNGGNGSNGGGNTVVVPVPGYGYGGGMGGFYGVDASIQRGFDTASIITKLDGINSGICNLGYDQLAQMNGINNNIMQTGFGLQQAINNDTVANMQNTNALSTQLANCCCENRQGQAQIEFTLSQLGCQLQNTMNQNTQAIMQNDDANFRALNDTVRDGFTQLAMNQKDAEIASLRQALNDCNLQGVANAAVASAVNQIRPPAVPSYPAANPNGMGNWAPQVLSGYSNGRCDCNNNWNNCC